MSKMDIKGKRFLLTGASGGIGRELVLRLKALGAEVIAVDRKGDLGLGVLSFGVDLTDGGQVRDFAEKFEGELDGVIHCAGVMKRGDFVASSEEDYDLVMDVNLKAVWLVQKYLDSKFKEDAVVLIISSRHGFNVKVDPALYSLSKAAVWDFGVILQKSRENFRVKVAFPGSVDTDMAWSDVPESEWEEKKKRVVTTSFIGEKLMELLVDDEKRFLVYDEVRNEYGYFNEI